MGERQPVLKSERVIINAPMSFVGAAQRLSRLIPHEWEPRWLVVPLAWVVLLVPLLLWWSAIVLWYVAFGLLLVPYRLLRRGARKRKAEARRHRETLAAIEKRSDTQ